MRASCSDQSIANFAAIGANLSAKAERVKPGERGSSTVRMKKTFVSGSPKWFDSVMKQFASVSIVETAETTPTTSGHEIVR